MSSSTPANGLFEEYLKKYVKIPVQIKNDVKYCQRAFNCHVAVYNFVVINAKYFGDEHLTILKVIDKKIKSIHAEMQPLFMCIRRIKIDFNKKLQRKKIPPNEEALNQFIHNEMKLYLDDESKGLVPQKVVSRDTKEVLMRKYVTPYTTITVSVKTVADEAVANASQAGEIPLQKPMSQLTITEPVEGPPRVVNLETAKLEKTDLPMTPMTSGEQDDSELPVSKKVTKDSINRRQPLKKEVTKPIAVPVYTFATLPSCVLQMEPAETVATSGNIEVVSYSDNPKKGELAASQNFWNDEPTATRARAEECGWAELLPSDNVSSAAAVANKKEKRKTRLSSRRAKLAQQNKDSGTDKNETSTSSHHNTSTICNFCRRERLSEQSSAC